MEIPIPIKSATSSLRQLLATENPSKMMKNALHFTLKAFLFSRYLNFSLTFWSCRKTA